MLFSTTYVSLISESEHDLKRQKRTALGKPQNRYFLVARSLFLSLKIAENGF